MTVVVAGGIVCLVLIVMMTHVKRAFIMGGVAALLVMSGHFTAIPSDVVGTAARAVGIALFAIAAATRRANEDTSLRRVAGLRSVALLGGAVYLIASLASMDGLTAAAGVTFVLSVLAVDFLARSPAATEVIAGTLVAVALVLTLCAAMYVAGISDAVAGGRLRGVFVNANTLGFFAALYLLSLIVVRGSNWRMLGAIPASFALILTSSRSPLLALAIGVIAYVLVALLKGQLKRMVAVLSGTIAVIAALWFSGVFDQTTVFRAENSRADGTDYALNVAQWDWFNGIGYKAATVEIASTPLRWLAEAGLVAALLIVVAYLAVAAASFRAGVEVIASATFGIVSSLFEGWYLAGGSALFILYWVVQCGASIEPTRYLRGGGADAAKNPRVQSVGASRRLVPRRLPPPLKPRARLG